MAAAAHPDLPLLLARHILSRIVSGVDSDHKQLAHLALRADDAVLLVPDAARVAEDPAHAYVAPQRRARGAAADARVVLAGRRPRLVAAHGDLAAPKGVIASVAVGRL